jgi:hypothetical protein
MLIFQVLVLWCMPKIVCGIAKLMMTISFANKILKPCKKIDIWDLISLMTLQQAFVPC